MLVVDFKFKEKEKILIFCYIDGSNEEGSYTIYFKSKKFNYKEYEIEINIAPEKRYYHSAKSMQKI